MSRQGLSRQSIAEGPSARHPAAAALTEDAYRTIIERAHDIITLIDVDRRFTYQSAAFTRIFGYAADDVIGMKVIDFIHPNDAALVTDTLARLTAGATHDERVTLRFRHIDGTWRWIESVASNQLADPSLRAIMVVSREVTALRQIEAQLRQVEEVGKIGHWRWRVGAKQPYWSEGMYRLGDFNRAEWDPAADWTRAVHPDDVAAMQVVHRQAMNDGQPFNYRCRLRHRDGRHRIVATVGRAETDVDGNVTALLCVCQDVTDQVVAEEAVRSSEQQYRLLAANASDIIARFTPTEGLLFVSPAIDRLLGYPPEKMQGFGFVDIFYSTADYQHFWQKTQLAATQDETVTVTSRVVHRDGHMMWLESSVHAVAHHQTGEVVELVIIARDATERKRYEFELLTTRDAAETANRTKSLFLANMSHELRTPLNAIIGFSEVLKEQMFGELGSIRYIEYARDIHDSGLHLLELINDILDMSKIEAGKYMLHFEESDLEEIVDTSIRVVRLRAQEAGVTIDRMLGEDAITVLVDRRAIKQILLNLISNAIKFTLPGGHVMVSVERGENRVLLRVSDTGIGIPDEQLPRLAQPFEQVDSGQHGEKPPGTGLGLALVKALTELHGGSLRIDSRVGTGTVVTVELPV